MSNIEKLESTIQRFIEQFYKLQKERDNALQEAQRAQDEVYTANDKIHELETNLRRLEEKLSGIVNFDTEKKEIVNRIESIICRIDNINIDDITNEQ